MTTDHVLNTFPLNHRRPETRQTRACAQRTPSGCLLSTWPQVQILPGAPLPGAPLPGAPVVQLEQFTLVTRDANVRRYEVPVIRA